MRVSFLIVFLAGCSAGEGAHLPSTSATTLASAPSATVPSASAPRANDTKRIEFARALSKLGPGSSAEEVIAALGPPDDVKTERDPGGITATRTVEVWRYGTNGHLTFGTLGTVHVQEDKKVQYVFGGRGGPPAEGLFDESELRDLLRVIDAVSSYQGDNDPLKLIRAVNALQPLGKAKAIAAVTEYLRVSSDFDDPGREGTFLLLRTLFDVPADPGSMPAMRVGAPSTPAPSDPRTLPRFPIVIVDDIPFTIIRGYSLAGQAEPPEMHLEWFAEKGTLRARPLAPTDTPMATLERMIGSPSTAFLKQTGLAERDRALIIEQGVRLLDTVVRPELRQNVGPDDLWKQWKTAYGDKKVKWDASANKYTLADGSSLAAPPRVIHQRAIWRPTMRGAAVQLILERKGAKEVGLELRIDLEKGASIPAAKVRVTTKAGTDVTTFDVAATSAPPNSTSGMVMGRALMLAEGESVRVEISAGSDVQKSEFLTP